MGIIRLDIYTTPYSVMAQSRAGKSTEQSLKEIRKEVKKSPNSDCSFDYLTNRIYARSTHKSISSPSKSHQNQLLNCVISLL